MQSVELLALLKSVSEAKFLKVSKCQRGAAKKEAGRSHEVFPELITKCRSRMFWVASVGQHVNSNKVVSSNAFATLWERENAKLCSSYSCELDNIKWVET